jgi:hypothetical protein
MMGFTTEGLSTAEAKEKRLPRWNWAFGATLVGPYLDGNQLAAFCLVSKDLHKNFSPILWSDPLIVLKGTQRPACEYRKRTYEVSLADHRLDKLYQFMYLAHSARLELRSLVQTLDFGQILNFRLKTQPQTSVEKQIFDCIYHGAWFMHCTKLFPHLRFAVMDGLHGLSYTATDMAEQDDPLGLFAPRYPDSSITIASDAAGNQSVSSAVPSLHVEPTKMKPVLFSFNGTGRIVLLKEMFTSNLMYLDLSYTMRDADLYPSSVLEFRNLRVLKLRGCRLVDSELVRWIPVQLWCLDVRDNFLTDAVVENVLPHIFLEQIQPPQRTADELRDGHLYEDVPQYQRNDDEKPSTIAPLRPYQKEEFIDYVQTHANFLSINYQILDDNDPLLRRTGLTHLFISGNKLSSRGVKLLLTGTNRLQHLDVGSVEATNSRKFYVPYTTAYAQLNSRSTLGLLRESGSRIEALRIHHSIVTFTPTLITAGSRNTGFSLPLVKQAEEYGGMLRLDHLLKEPKQLAFSPLQNYRITKLTLTGLPKKSYGFTIDRLKHFLNDCAVQEANLREARRLPTNRRAPELLKGLRTLRLEFLPEDRSAQSPVGGSVSGDRDADNFLASSEGDFSFFGQDTMSSVSRRGSTATTSGSGTVTGPISPASRMGSFIESATLQRQMSGFSSGPGSSGSAAAPPRYNEVFNVIHELKRWRAANSGRWTGDILVGYQDSP